MYYAACYNQLSNYFRVETERNHKKKLDVPQDPLIAKNFERFLRSIEFK